jgi:hypothetical protein
VSDEEITAALASIHPKHEDIQYSLNVPAMEPKPATLEDDNSTDEDNVPESNYVNYIIFCHTKDLSDSVQQRCRIHH